MLGREADLRVANQRLLEPQPQSILVAAGDQRETRGGADGGIGVALKEAHSSRGDAVNIWRGEVAASVTGHVGIAEVVGKNKDDVRRLRGRLGIRTDATRRKRSGPKGGIAQGSSTGHSRLPSHRRLLSFSGLKKTRGPALDLSNAFMISLLICILDHRV